MAFIPCHASALEIFTGMHSHTTNNRQYRQYSEQGIRRCGGARGFATTETPRYTRNVDDDATALQRIGGTVHDRCASGILGTSRTASELSDRTGQEGRMERSPNARSTLIALPTPAVHPDEVAPATL